MLKWLNFYTYIAPLGLQIRSYYTHCAPLESGDWSIAFYRHIAPLERKTNYLTGGGTPPLQVSESLDPSGEFFSSDAHETEFPRRHPALGSETCLLVFNAEIFRLGVEVV